MSNEFASHVLKVAARFQGHHTVQWSAAFGPVEICAIALRVVWFAESTIAVSTGVERVRSDDSLDGIAARVAFSTRATTWVAVAAGVVALIGTAIIGAICLGAVDAVISEATPPNGTLHGSLLQPSSP